TASPVARPLCLPWPCLTKKLTVIGTIGQTQGMTRAPSPPIAEKIKKGIRPRSACRATSLTTSLDVAFSTTVTFTGGGGADAGAGGGGGAAARADVAASEAVATPGRTVSATSGKVQRPGNLQVCASQIW